MMITFPFIVKQVAVSTTVRPVTQLALAEVKRASINLIFPFTVISGSISKNAPEKIRIRKESANMACGLILVRVNH